MPPQHDISHEDLLSELQTHNAYFDSVVNTIPASLYVAGASGDDAYNPKYLKGQHKESKEARKARNKIAKKEKFDPDKIETTLEAKKRVKKEREESDGDGDDDDGRAIEMSDGDGDDENDAAAVWPPEGKSGASGDDDNGNGSYASRIEMLRAKLHAKMAEKRAAAGIAPDAAGEGDAASAANVRGASAPALVSKRAARRAEKRRRREAAKQRNKKKASSEAERTHTDKRVVNLGGSKLNAPDASSSSSPATTAAQDLATIDYQPLAGLKPKLGGTLDDKSLGGKGKKKKNLEMLLADAERKQARLRELKSSGAEEDREKAKNLEWGEALKVAGGSNTRKTKDPKLIKKALKRKAKKKAASAKAWNVRLDQAKDAAAKKQQIRSHNLESRKLGGAVGANLSAKRIVERDGEGGGDGDEGKKKEKRRRLGPHSGQGMNRAGFEGKKSGFINGEGVSSGSSGGKGKK
eukprot:CAMPEP_0172533780 /NCGR_PEP_ID=MMETSP1067-20121228/6365_1 /TAXON_ID=265564 ORGANISM="Thalassiosira punctigera, Strain Tpunct2005C2" /NCGR_SAMPLE_ID=MMETSP1067 /ASSEMBLY_ACC=CAM_ASM_000444 /LENGTH=464 /DNA_ID=CAMNT_0013318469 /DNA_START=197 /DNA_END=1591 /DNA_ORIENTATION=+